MFEWHEVSTMVPTEFLDVLVETDLYNDDAKDYFVAHYCPFEKEWIQEFNFQPEDAPYLKVVRKVLPTDRWCLIDPETI